MILRDLLAREFVDYSIHIVAPIVATSLFSAIEHIHAISTALLMFCLYGTNSAVIWKPLVIEVFLLYLKV